ncbi:MAG: threonine--tRNA ligase [Ignavibacteriae bacterium]|nr:threonine--tRNA ligase [Ignavibacteria bacterium]MBI3365494.1 threonine--tRNA ligase [Ignavibacteriota bacterium]
MPTIKLTFPDGSVREFEQGATGLDVAKSISSGLAREALAVEFNGEVWDLSRNFFQNGTLKILKWTDDGGKFAYWHSSAHLMAEAIESLFPGTRFGIGPPIENGFYYDIDMGDHALSPDDLSTIEEKMYELTKRDVPYVREEKSWDDAVSYFQKKGDPYKLELLAGLKDKTISFYHQGNFTDLCYGPHIPSTGRIKAIKLLSVAGAYWRGSEKNKMLQRIYGITFPLKKELDDYLFRLEEAKRRDHRKLGKELDLFVFHDIAPGAPFWLPKGMIVFRELEKLIREELDMRGYQEISTPIMVKKDLWEQSGHWTHYQENMFLIESEETTYSLKPMNCPESTFVYKHKLRSYKDLPLRFSELGRLHRNELSGALGGMFRVRQITMDDAHIYCRPDQIFSEINQLIELVTHVYSMFGLKPMFNLATKPDKGMGDPLLWEKAEASLKQALETNNIAYKLKPKDGAFYGPKIDIQIEDAIGREWQVATIQLDFVMLPERFHLEYVAEDGSRQQPVAIHRAVFGSFERFIGIITEHFAGSFPTWLSPIQAVVLPITDAHVDYAKNVFDCLAAGGVRIELDDRNEKVNYKIRDWETKKVPYMLVVGEKEKSGGSVAVRQHKKGDIGMMPLGEFIGKIRSEIAQKIITS